MYEGLGLCTFMLRMYKFLHLNLLQIRNSMLSRCCLPLSMHPPQDGVTALMIAIHQSSSTVVEVLFRAKPDVNVATYAEVHMYTRSRLYCFSTCNLNAYNPTEWDSFDYCLSQRGYFNCAFSPPTWSRS